MDKEVGSLRDSKVQAKEKDNSVDQKLQDLQKDGFAQNQEITHLKTANQALRLDIDLQNTDLKDAIKRIDKLQ